MAAPDTISVSQLSRLVGTPEAPVIVDHTTTLAGGEPILVLDMYEHAYQMDFGAKAADYVNTIMAATNWSNSDRLYAQYRRG